MTLGEVYFRLGRYNDAERLFRKVKDIGSRELAQDHPLRLKNLNNLAALYQQMERYDEAALLYRKALEIKRQNHLKDDASYLNVANNLATLYMLTGRYPAAQRLLEETRETFRPEKKRGAFPRTYSACLFNLCTLYAVTGRPQEALALNLEVVDRDLMTLSRVFCISSQKHKSEFLRTVLPHIEQIHCLVFDHLRDSPSARRAVLHVLLRSKAVSLEALRVEQYAFSGNANPEARAKLERLKQTCSRLAFLTLRGPGERPAEAYRNEILALEKNQDRFEAELARLSKEFELQQRLYKVTIDNVQAQLAGNAVLLTFCCTQSFHFKEREFLPLRYLAYVLKKTENVPALIDLGEAQAIDRTIANFRAAAQKPNGNMAPASRRVYDLLFAPLEKHIPQGSHLVISPDGQLSILPFEALWDGRQYLVDKYKISYLDAGRDVVRFAEREKSSGDVILLCDPDYDISADARAQALKETQKPAELAMLDSNRRSLDSRGLKFKRLPGTREEGNVVSKLFASKGISVRKYEGAQALEDVLKNVESPRVLHLATHGFFLEDKFGDALRKASEKRGISGLSLGLEQDRFIPPVIAENPLLRSGLALAGANRLADAKPGIEDGIATALELSRINLLNTDLVVLSACDTGVGEIKVGEGVFGLRRAIQHAGARSIVMSLWKVDDKATRLFMERFYTNWLSGMPKFEALQEAKKWLRTQEIEVVDPVESIRRGVTVMKKRKLAHPYYWAPFVLVGDWR